jgi:hypothetical protein
MGRSRVYGNDIRRDSKVIKPMLNLGVTELRWELKIGEGMLVLLSLGVRPIYLYVSSVYFQTIKFFTSAAAMK